MDVSVGIVRTHWSGTTGGPGLSQLAVVADDASTPWDGTYAQACADAVQDFWDSTKNTIPNEITLTVDPVVDVYSIVSGALEGSFQAAAAPATVTGTNTGSYSMPAGAKLNLRTAGISNNRRVRGSLFIVPCGGDVFDASGNVSSTPRTNWVNAANAMQSALGLVNRGLMVWGRPTTTSSNDGHGSQVTGFDVPTKGAILRSRRD